MRAKARQVSVQAVWTNLRDERDRTILRAQERTIQDRRIPTRFGLPCDANRCWKGHAPPFDDADPSLCLRNSIYLFTTGARMCFTRLVL